MKVLMIFPQQWGYNTDFFFYGQELSRYCEVHYIGYNLGKKMVDNGQVRVMEIPYTGPLSIIRYYRAIIEFVRREQPTHLFVNYFLTCSLLTLLFGRKRKVIVDVRTSFIFKHKRKTWWYNKILRCELGLFRYITVISEGLKVFLKLPARAHVLPLGGPAFPKAVRTFDELAFFYVGTFYDRNIANTVRAYAKFRNAAGITIPSRYTIVGTGSKAEIQEIKDAIAEAELAAYVHLVEPVFYPVLTDFFMKHNVGISYIPLTVYYDCQPPTKTFEYLLAGMAVVGTNTTENRRVINDWNGVLTDDSVDGFYQGMLSIYHRRNAFDTLKIQQHAAPYQWSRIVADNFIGYLQHGSN